MRFRGATKARDLLTKGISYVEFRSFDINPYAAYGMTEEDMRFIHLFLVSLLWRGETVRQQDIKRGQDYKEEVAMAHPYTPAAQEQEGIALLKDMLEMLDCLQPSTIAEDKKIVEEKLQQFYHPTTTIAAKLVNDIEQQGDYQSVGLRLAKHYKNLAMQEPFALKGFKNLELSTQILMFDAIQKGIKVEVLDEHDQFLSLTAFDRVEYVKNGNMTSRDSISSYMAMANKVITKKIIEKQGFHVPFGYECHTEEEALALYSLLQGIAFVIKPKSTNYGLGITIFKQTPTLEDYTKAIQFAFAEDSTILVEHFVTGTEYRFFVINGETKAVLLRKPAHVIGDGVHSIAELVEEKNKHPYRGYGHQAPLTKIELGDIEILLLKQQGFVSSDIPAKDQIVYLRENSNISTGGDSVDVTKEMDNSYKQLAAEVAVAMGAVVCGVDMMIEDYTQPATKSVHQRYAVIEANFNPAMMMQIYPEKGEGRRLTMDILQLLFPEIVKGASE